MLKDLIRGMRAHQRDELKFIAQATDEIRDEVKSKDIKPRTAAILKLTYLDMLGYEMFWASFYVLEVMSSPAIPPESNRIPRRQLVGPRGHKRPISHDKFLEEELDIDPLEVAGALNGLAQWQFVSADLDELITMLTHSRAAILKAPSSFSIICPRFCIPGFPSARQTRGSPPTSCIDKCQRAPLSAPSMRNSRICCIVHA